MELINHIEETIIIFLQSFCNDAAVSFLKIMAEFGAPIVLVAVIGFIYWCFDKKVALRLIICLATANVFAPMLKNVAKRVRPYMVNSDIKCYKAAYDGDAYDIGVQGYSFPSVHMVNCACVYGTLYKAYKNVYIKIATALIIILVALSRIVLGVHYVSDVLVGFLLGAIICLIIVKSLEKFDKKIVYLIFTVLGAFGFLFCRSYDYFMGFGMMTGSMVGNLFEERFVKFTNTKNIWEIIIRIVVGCIVFFLVYKGTKLPFSEEFLDNQTMASYVVEAIRYFVIVFIAMGVYPLFFKLIHFGKKKVKE